MFGAEFSAMRSLAAILVAVMSVTTGGSLRCPCQLWTLLGPGAPTCEGPPTQTSATENLCACKGHRNLPPGGPSEPSPCQKTPSCPHTASVDVILPSAGERLTADEDSGFSVPLVIEGAYASHHVFAVGLLNNTAGHPSEPSDRLRFCHSFRS